MKSLNFPPARCERGMTLVEILMVIGIIGITLTIGVPSMASMVNDMRLSSSANDYLGLLNVARSEAGKRGEKIGVCASAPPFLACNAAVDADWALGAVVYVDANNNGVFDAGETVVRVLDAMPGGLTVTGATATPGTFVGRFRYKPSGASDSARTFQVCKVGSASRNISVSLQGRASIQTGAVAAACP